VDEKKDRVSENFASVANEFKGQKVAVICARYQYRGILSKVTHDCIVLANSTSVETSGNSQQPAPQTEDNIGSSVVIKNDAIEILYQPHWCFAPLPSEVEKKR
jgi:hypothetical protein